MQNTHHDDNFCTILTNTKQRSYDENYLHEVDDDACPHKAKEIKHLSLHNSYLHHKSMEQNSWLYSTKQSNTTYHTMDGI